MSADSKAPQGASPVVSIDVDNGAFRGLVHYHVHEIAAERGQGHWLEPIHCLTGALNHGDPSLTTSQIFSAGFELGIKIALAVLRDPLGNPRPEITELVDSTRDGLEHRRAENAEHRKLVAELEQRELVSV